MIIKTNRLVLRPWKLEDANSIVEGINNFDVVKNITAPFPYTKKDAVEFITKHISHNKDFYFAITLKENGKVIGATDLYLNNQGVYHGGIWLNQNYQNMGYGTEAWTARAKFAFDYLKLTELQNGFFDFNQNSKNMQQKIGYKIVGEKLNYSPALKKEVKEIITLLKKNDFENFFKNTSYKISINK